MGMLNRNEFFIEKNHFQVAPKTEPMIGCETFFLPNLANSIAEVLAFLQLQRLELKLPCDYSLKTSFADIDFSGHFPHRTSEISSNPVPDQFPIPGSVDGARAT
jgi:hypothetical protein